MDRLKETLISIIGEDSSETIDILFERQIIQNSLSSPETNYDDNVQYYHGIGSVILDNVLYSILTKKFIISPYLNYAAAVKDYVDSYIPVIVSALIARLKLSSVIKNFTQIQPIYWMNSLYGALYIGGEDIAPGLGFTLVHNLIIDFQERISNDLFAVRQEVESIFNVLGLQAPVYNRESGTVSVDANALKNALKDIFPVTLNDNIGSIDPEQPSPGLKRLSAYSSALTTLDNIGLTLSEARAIQYDKIREFATNRFEETEGAAYFFDLPSLYNTRKGTSYALLVECVDGVCTAVGKGTGKSPEAAMLTAYNSIKK